MKIEITPTPELALSDAASGTRVKVGRMEWFRCGQLWLTWDGTKAANMYDPKPIDGQGCTTRCGACGGGTFHVNHTRTMANLICNNCGRVYCVEDVT